MEIRKIRGGRRIKATLISSGDILSDTLCNPGLPPRIPGLFIAVFGSAHMRRIEIAIPSLLPSLQTFQVHMVHRQGLGAAGGGET